MFRSVVRAPLWRTLPSQFSQRIYSQRFYTTTSATKKSRWKATIFKFALAAGGIYYYSTICFPTEDLEDTFTEDDGLKRDCESNSLPTIEAILEDKKRIRERKLAEKQSVSRASYISTPAQALSGNEPVIEDNRDNTDDAHDAHDTNKTDDDSKTGREGAFDPETGIINWDCPCLGGMAHGPCGEEFKDAFSCFVYSKEDPKGFECIDRFKTMQNCFRKYPEIYGAELDEESENETSEEALRETHQSSQTLE